MCDNCWSTRDLGEQPTLRQKLARRLRSRLRSALDRELGRDANATCPQTYDVCAHIRGVGDPSHLNVTNLRGERQSVHRRMHPPSWWRRAVRMALADAPPAAHAPSLPTLLVHTNDERTAHEAFRGESVSG